MPRLDQSLQKQIIERLLLIFCSVPLGLDDEPLQLVHHASGSVLINRGL